MMLIDTHCHLDFPEFNQDRTDVIERAREVGVVYILNIGSSITGSKFSIELAQRNPMLYATIGIHPHYASETNGEIPKELEDLLRDNEKIVGIGEVGLDYYKNFSPKELQKKLFVNFINLAKKHNLPIIIHTREAHRDTLDILKTEFKDKIKGVMHCFSGDEEYLRECLNIGLYVSFTCNLTFKNAERLRSLAKKVPIERLLLETDAPFLAPQEYRGKRNEPSYLIYLVKVLASIYGVSEEDIARITTHNAGVLFGLPLTEPPKIAYSIRNSLYLNITNRCTNDCDFCIRKKSNFVKGHNLILTREPSTGEIIEAIGDPTGYKEVVFCGYGEPTLRLDIVKDVARVLKNKGMKVRMVTNGEGNLIHGRPIVKELKGLIDKFSISLNVDNNQMFDKVCKSSFGKGVFDEIKEFVRECKEAGMEVEITFLNLPGVDIKRCRDIADKLGVEFRMRSLNNVG